MRISRSRSMLVLAAAVSLFLQAPRALTQGASPTVVSMWGGARHCIVLMSDGTVWDWGLNTFGDLGDNTVSVAPDYSNDRHTPIQVHGPGNVGFLTSIAAVMGGEAHNFALKSDGTVWAWGNNSFFGQLGDGTMADSYTPVKVVGLNSIVSLGGRGYHSLAVKSDGTVWAWGDNKNGELGNNTTTDSAVPVQVLGLNSPTLVTGGGFFSLALMPDGTLRSWGQNNHGQLADGSTTNRLTPVAVNGLSNVMGVSAGWQHAVAVRGDGTVWTWGLNSEGELGNGTTTDSTVPVQVQGLTGVTAVSAGDCHTAALKADGTVWTWGCNDANSLGSGQLGDGNDAATEKLSTKPVLVKNLTNVVAIAARDYHNIARRTDGTVWTWGFNANGQLGDGTTTDRNAPVQVVGLTTLPPPTTDPHSSVDAPASGSIVGSAFSLAGWALDLGATGGSGTGVDQVHVWAFPSGGAASFLGVATLGLARSDISGKYGQQFLNSGFSFNVSGLAAGSYTLTTYLHSTVTGSFTQGASTSVTVSVPGPAMAIDAPQAAASVTPPFVAQGWAIDRAASSGAGVDAVHIYAVPTAGGAATFLGASTYGLPRTDIGALFGSQFTNAGFSFTVSSLSPGSYRLMAFAHSAVSHTFNNSQSVTITVKAPVSLPTASIDIPSAGATLNQPLTVAGWAIDRGATAGTGVDIVHVWALNSSGVGAFLGQATYGLTRTDIGNLFGQNFASSGFTISGPAPPIASGNYTLYVYVHSTISGAFTLAASAPVTLK